jgi:hypothetical protein
MLEIVLRETCVLHPGEHIKIELPREAGYKFERLVTYGQPLEELVHGATFHLLDPDSEQPKRAITLRGITVQWPVNREMTDDGPRPERVTFFDPQSMFDRRVPRYDDSDI